jgi:FAD:protein FMN transferase
MGVFGGFIDFGRVTWYTSRLRSEVLPVRAFLLIFTVASAVAASAEEAPLFTAHHLAMGTEYTITLVPPSKDMYTEELTHITDEAFAAVDALEKRISNWIPESALSKMNQSAGDAPYKTSQEVIDLLLISKKYWQDSEGGFDVTVGPLLKLWGFYKSQGHLPKPEELQEALAKVGFNKLEINETEQTVHFTVPGMSVDFGGIGKGLALDRAAEVLRSQGVTAAMLDSGTSSVVAIGTPPGKPGWTVRIRSPYNKKEYVDEVVIRDESLSSSSDSENYVEIDGKKYGHHFDPRTGKPIEGVLGVTSFAPKGVDSDALSTTFFVMGIEKIKAYCKAHPQNRAIVVVSEGGALKPVRINFPAN